MKPQPADYAAIARAGRSMIVFQRQMRSLLLSLAPAMREVGKAFEKLLRLERSTARQRREAAARMRSWNRRKGWR